MPIVATYLYPDRSLRICGSISYMIYRCQDIREAIMGFRLLSLQMLRRRRRHGHLALVQVALAHQLLQPLSQPATLRVKVRQLRQRRQPSYPIFTAVLAQEQKLALE
jgi:hypothetical protein